MKLCPQCEFIYEDDQGLCDMDGETLVYSRLGVSPVTVPAVTGTRSTKARLRIIAPVIAGLVVLVLLSLAYYASSAPLYSKFGSRSQKPEAPKASLQQQIAAPLDNSSSQPTTTAPPSPANPEAASESDRVVVGRTAEIPASESVRSEVATKATNHTRNARDSRLAIAKGLPPLPQLTPLPQIPPLRRLPAAKPVAKLPGSTTPQEPGLTNQKLAVTSQKALVVDVKPAGGKENKPSRVRAFFKKTGQVLKKPFKF